MTLLSGFYVVTAYLGAWLVRFGAGLAGLTREMPESSLGGNFSPVSGDPLLKAIIHGLADADVDVHAAPAVRDSILASHIVVPHDELPHTVVTNGFVCAGGISRHEHTSAQDARFSAVSLLAISEVLSIWAPGYELDSEGDKR